jgi:hypothetical protein
MNDSFLIDPGGFAGRGNRFIATACGYPACVNVCLTKLKAFAIFSAGGSNTSYSLGERVKLRAIT